MAHKKDRKLKQFYSAFHFL